MEKKLTIKQEKFCQAYARLLDKSAAYREVYASKGGRAETTHQEACKLASLPNVAQRIDELTEVKKKVANTKFSVSAEEMLRHLNILREARIDEYVKFEDGNLIFKDFKDLTPNQLMCIQSIKHGKFGIELTLHGKDWTIEKINKHIGFYEKDNEQKKSEQTVNFDMSKISDATLNELEAASGE